jgi:hypothetical protein
MGTLTGTNLADTAAGLIHDPLRVRWTDTDWLTWLNDAQREAVHVKPDIYTTNQSILLTRASTKQALPDTAIQLLEVVRNMGADGATPGSAVTVVSKETMDNTVPTWHADAATGEVDNFVYDPRDPLRFYVRQCLGGVHALSGAQPRRAIRRAECGGERTLRGVPLGARCVRTRNQHQQP